MRTIFILLVIILGGLPGINHAQISSFTDAVQTTRSIKPGEKHQFQLQLQKNQLAFLKFEQQGADIVIQVTGPDGKQVWEQHGRNGGKGPELVQVNPGQTGLYTITVSAFEEQKKAGRYTPYLDKLSEKGATPADQLHQLIGYWADQGYLPGFATAVLTKDEILFQKTYGYADLKNKKPYTPETVQNIGSVSKTLIGLSLMKATEEGKLNLDDAINQYLPYEVVNPHFPSVPITIRQLANHTSSIGEPDDYEKSYLLLEPFRYQKGEISKSEYQGGLLYAKNKNREMDDFLKALLHKDGTLYKKKNFLKQRPGSKYSYSNVAATLAAHIIERIYEMPYAEFTQTHLLEPLGMKASGWSFETINAKKHTDLHFRNHRVIPRYTLITYPDGGLLTNIQDLSRYLQNQMKGYYGDTALLSAAAYQQMMKPSLSPEQQERPNRNYGIFWSVSGNRIGHNGGDPGAACLIRFDAEKQIGWIMMMNILPETPMAVEAFQLIWGWLEAYGERMK